MIDPDNLPARYTIEHVVYVEPHIVEIQPKSCTNCLYAHFMDDEGGYCDWPHLGRVPSSMKEIAPTLRPKIDRRNPFANCPQWQPRQIMINVGV